MKFIFFVVISIFLFFCYINNIYINRYIFTLSLVIISFVVSYFLRRPRYSKKFKTQVIKEKNPKNRLDALIVLKDQGHISEDTQEFAKFMYTSYAENQEYQKSLEWLIKYFDKLSISLKPRTPKTPKQIEDQILIDADFETRIKILKERFENGYFKDKADYLFSLINCYYIEGHYTKCLEYIDELSRLNMRSSYKFYRYFRTGITMPDHIDLTKIEILIALKRIDEATKILYFLQERPNKTRIFCSAINMKLAKIAVAKKNSTLARQYMYEIVHKDIRKWTYRSTYIWLYELFFLQIQCTIIENKIDLATTELEYFISNCPDRILLNKAKKLEDALKTK